MPYQIVLPTGNKLSRKLGPGGVIGPHLPRNKRTREKQLAHPRSATRSLARDGITKVIAVDIQGLTPARFAYSLCSDTERNKAFFTDRKLLADDGGDLLIQKSSWVQSHAFFNSDWVGNTKIQGALACGTLNLIHDGFFPFDDATKYPPAEDHEYLVPLGPKGWSLARPAQPIVSLGQTIAEIKQLPLLLKSKIEKLKDIGDYTLATAFGWVPLFNDVKDTLNYVKRVDGAIAFLRRNNGKPVRRKVHIGNWTDSGTIYETDGMLMYNTGPYEGGSAAGGIYTTVEYLRNRDAYFSGNFVFYLNMPDSPTIERRLAAELLGLRVTPKLVWELMPWSWLIDWFGNVGDVIANSYDNLDATQLSRYAYVMGTCTRQYKIMTSNGYRTSSIERRFKTVSRKKVDPYGASFELPELSARRAAIVTALGLQRI